MNFEKLDFNPEKRQEEWKEEVFKYFKGEMHAHSLYSNRQEMGGGKEGMVHSDERLLSYAEKLGLDFLCFSEHSSNPEDPKKLEENDPICESILKQQEKIREINEKDIYDLTAYQSVEANIMFDENGKAIVDMPDSVLSQLDLVVASRHKIDDKFEPEKIKESFLAATQNENVDIIGHPYRYIEFYENDWRYFKKYNQNKELGEELQEMENNSDWDSIKQIIGKNEPTTDKLREYNLLFNNLKEDYWNNWGEVLKSMEDNNKCFEINLSSFDPNKEYFKTLLKKTTEYKNLNYSIAYDFHNLGQLDKYKTNHKVEGVKNPARAKGASRLLDLIELLKELNISPDRIINSSEDNFKKFINSKRNN
ncbi:MAG: hypothetical protein PF488_03175 [Patescibacteria group bacterium]|jgi:histidinol phosphatase-like PHP family hydrolase|nr:hypothetical protein [Patescibacteria group bacterium]